MATDMSITQFKAKLTGGGARSNLFEVVGAWPVGVDGGAGDFHFFCKAAEAPPRDIGNIQIPFRGRELQVPGDTTYEPWTITVLNDENYKFRNAFEDWHDLINEAESNRGVTSQRTGDQGIYTDWEVYQLDRTGTRIQGYKLYGLWPQNVGPIEYNNENTNQITEYTITTVYQYWKHTLRLGNQLGL